MGTKLVRTLIVFAVLCIRNGYGDQEHSSVGKEPYKLAAIQRSEVVKPTFIEKPKDVIIFGDDIDSITLTAKFRGDPMPTVTWEMVGDADWMIDDYRIKVAYETKGDEGMSILMIDDLDELDFGEYRCTLTNKFGTKVSSTANVSYIDVCEGVSCGNRSTCFANKTMKPECRCRTPYAGENCETNVCEGVTCGNRSYCALNEMGDDYACLCSAPYMGEDCEIDVCADKPCGKRGMCDINRKENTYKCYCTSDYTGKDCEIDVCREKPCADRGLCRINQRRNNYECYCFLSYIGRDCKTDVCKEQPCGEEGYCKTNREKTDYECSCFSPYTGKHCETNACEGVTCGERSICTLNEQKNASECSCRSTYTGKYCEIDVCEGAPCGNRSICTINREKNHFECICKSPYTGKDCETASCNAFVCYNGGTCKLTQDKSDFKCLCPKAYEGRWCEIDLGVPKFIGEPQNNIQYNLGETVEVTVHFSGFPIPTATWKKRLDATWKVDGERIQVLSGNDFSTLTIKKATKEDDGIYQCELTNKRGSAYSNIILFHNLDHIDTSIPIAPIVGGVIGAVLIAIVMVAAFVFISNRRTARGPVNVRLQTER